MKQIPFIIIGIIISLVSCNSSKKDKKENEQKPSTMTMHTSVVGDDIRIALEGVGNAVIDWGDGTLRDSIALVPNRSFHKHMYSDSTASHTITIIGDTISYLDCSYSELTYLDVRANKSLETLVCGWNRLKFLDLSQNKLLKRLTCHENSLTSLDFSENK